MDPIACFKKWLGGVDDAAEAREDYNRWVSGGGFKITVDLVSDDEMSEATVVELTDSTVLVRLKDGRALWLVLYEPGVWRAAGVHGTHFEIEPRDPA